MKIKFDIDCTPEEARTFLGLPDVKPMQETMMKEVEQRLQANLQAMDPETLLKTWLPAGMQGWEQMQKMFWSQLSGGAEGGGRSGGQSGGKTDKENG
jgi:hypothetical protein